MNELQFYFYFTRQVFSKISSEADLTFNSNILFIESFAMKIGNIIACQILRLHFLQLFQILQLEIYRTGYRS